jgi:hypothetical protein
MSMHPRGLAALMILILACGPGLGSGDTETSSDSSDSGHGSTGSVEESGSEMPCECTDSQICVANCIEGPPFGADLIENYRCVDAPICIELGPHTRECVEAACGSAWAWNQHCDPSPNYIDLLCDDSAIDSCNEIVKDCRRRAGWALQAGQGRGRHDEGDPRERSAAGHLQAPAHGQGLSVANAVYAGACAA